jgi:spore maturation protein CgeB
MNVLYIGQLSYGGTCLARANTLEEYGWKIKKFDTTPYLKSKNKLMASLQHWFLLGPDVFKYNHDLQELIKNTSQIDVVWFDKERWLFPDVLEKIKKETGAIIIHYTPDPAFIVHMSWHFVTSIYLYDLCITTKRYELNTYREKGAREVIFTEKGVDDRFVKCALCSKYEPRPADVVFVGHAEPYYTEMITYLTKITKNIRVHGPRWTDLAGKNSYLRGVAFDAVWGYDLPEALAKGKIGLGLLSKYYPDAFTMRTLEIPAAGAMLLAERTDEHREIFIEDKEAVFFSSKDELREKLIFYLKNEKSRIRIAKAGREKVLKKYMWKDVLFPVTKRIEKMVYDRHK